MTKAASVAAASARRRENRGNVLPSARTPRGFRDGGGLVAARRERGRAETRWESWGCLAGARPAPLDSGAAPTGSDGVRQDRPAGPAVLRLRSCAVARIPSVRGTTAGFGELRRRQLGVVRSGGRQLAAPAAAMPTAVRPPGPGRAEPMGLSKPPISPPRDDGPVGSRQGPIERGRARGQAARTAVGLDIRGARIQHGLSLKESGRPARLSAAQASRIERGLVGAPDVDKLAILCAAVGLELSVRAYPAGDPMRDAAHLALLGRFRARLHTTVRWRTEVPLPILGDLRAWDAVLVVEGRPMGVEAETRPRDVQALERRLALKMRDGQMESVILLLSATRSNRLLLRAHGDALAEEFPIPGVRAMELLNSGVHPGGSSIVLL